MMSTADRLSCPDGLPQLRMGGHLRPEDGACLMEYVSVLSGAAFSDHPRCTDPTLAAFARLVNDACTDVGRQRLALFAPALAATSAAGPRRTVAVVGAVVDGACTAAGEPTALSRHRRRAQRRYARVTGTGPLAAVARALDPVHRCGPARHRPEASVEALRGLPARPRDAALQEILAAAIAVGRAQSPQPAGLEDQPTPQIERLMTEQQR